MTTEIAHCNKTISLHKIAWNVKMIRLFFQFWWVGQTEGVTWVTWYSCTRDVSTTRTFSQQVGSQRAVREFIPCNFWATYICLLLEFSSLRILQGKSLSFWGNFVTCDRALLQYDKLYYFRSFQEANHYSDSKKVYVFIYGLKLAINCLKRLWLYGR